MVHVEGDEASAELRGGRRKFDEAEDIALLKDVLGYKAHIFWRGKMTEKFEKCTSSLNNGNELPWSANGKHCTNRFKLLIAKFRRTDRALSIASGVEDDYGERDQILVHVVSANDENEELGRLKRDFSARRDERLAKTGQEVRVSAKKRRTSERIEVDGGKCEGEEEGSLAPPSHYSDGAPTPTDSTKGRKRHKHAALDLEDLFAFTQEKWPIKLAQS
jgi:hypothetical protein